MFCVTHHTSHITHHTPHITHHTSHITHHTSHITHHTSPITQPFQCFMEQNVEPYGKQGWRCLLCQKKFSTENLMAVHFSRRHRDEALGACVCMRVYVAACSCAPLVCTSNVQPPQPPPPEWAESMDGQMPPSLDEEMLMHVSNSTNP